MFSIMNISEDQILEKLKTKLWNIELEHPLVLGAGIAKNISGPEGLEGYLTKVNASLLICGSITMKPFSGNSGEVCWLEPNGNFILNRMGLPNKGINELDNLPTIKQKLIGISVAAINPVYAGYCADQYVNLTHMAFLKHADMVELNLSCPNLDEPLCFDIQLVDGILFRLSKFFPSNDYNICVKVSPFSSGKQIQQLATLINEYPIIKGVSTMNTFPNALYYQKDKPVISSNDGLAGLSGSSIFPIALGQVAQWRKHLSSDKYIIGGGGVTTAQNVLDMRRAGANAVFMVSAVLTHQPRIFDQILNNLIDHYSEN